MPTEIEKISERYERRKAVVGGRLPCLTQGVIASR